MFVVLVFNAVPFFVTRCCSFQMGSAEDGHKAIKALNGIEIQG